MGVAAAGKDVAFSTPSWGYGPQVGVNNNSIIENPERVIRRQRVSMIARRLQPVDVFA